MLAGSMDQKTAIVAGLPIFAKLESRSLEAVATLARVVAVPAGTVIVREGEPAESFYVIVSGTVNVERLGRFVRSMSDGGFLGEVALIEGSERTATATCKTDCELLEFGSFEFGRVMTRFPDVQARVQAAVARRPHAEASLRMDESRALNVVERLYAALDDDDVDAFLRLCAEDVVFRYPAEGVLPYGGTWTGRDGVRQFLELHDGAEEILKFELGEMAASGASVFVRGVFEGRAKPEGSVWSTQFVHALVVVDGELAQWEAFFDSAAAVEAHRP